MAKTESHLKLPKKDCKGDLPDTLEDWVEYVNRAHDSALYARRKFEQQWVVNLAYYMGYQHLAYNVRLGTIEIPEHYEERPLVINRLGSWVEARHAKLTKNRPIPRVIPNSNEIEDDRGAKNADRALLHLWRKLRMENEYDKLTMMELICGTAFMKNVWDPFAGDGIMQYKKSVESEIFLDEDGVMEQEKVFMGEVSSKAKSAFSILPADDGIVEVKDQPYMIERDHMGVSELEKLYPELRGKIPKEDRDSVFTEYEKIVQRLGSPVFQDRQKDQVKRDGVNSQSLVKTFWLAPCYQYEKGLVLVVVGKQCAYVGKFPNDYGDNVFPIVKYQERQDGFHFWGQATIERLIPIQRVYNHIREQKKRAVTLMANPKWMVPKGAQIQEDALTDEVGEVVEYNPSVPEPHAAQLSGLPAYVSEFEESLLIDFRDVGGQREASQTPSPNLTASVAMQMQAELSEEIIGPILRRQGMSMEITANQQLLLMDQEWIEKRRVKILGEDNAISVQWFSNVDFRNHTDVHIEIESLFPDMRGAKRQTLLDLWDRRVIQDPLQLLKAFRWGNWDHLLEEGDKQQDVIEMGIAMMKKGAMPEVTPFDNHMMWMSAITKFIQTPEFLALIPERRNIFIQMLQMRTQLVMQQMPQGPQPQQNQAAVGTPFGPAKPAGAE